MAITISSSCADTVPVLRVPELAGGIYIFKSVSLCWVVFKYLNLWYCTDYIDNRTSCDRHSHEHNLSSIGLDGKIDII